MEQIRKTKIFKRSDPVEPLFGQRKIATPLELRTRPARLLRAPVLAEPRQPLRWPRGDEKVRHKWAVCQWDPILGQVNSPPSLEPILVNILGQVNSRVYFRTYFGQHFGASELTTYLRTYFGQHFGAGEFTAYFRTYVSGDWDWDVHWRYGVFTHSQICGSTQKRM